MQPYLGTILQTVRNARIMATVKAYKYAFVTLSRCCKIKCEYMPHMQRRSLLDRQLLKFRITLLLPISHKRHSYPQADFVHKIIMRDARQCSNPSKANVKINASHPNTGERSKRPSMHLLLAHLLYTTPVNEICRKYSAKGIHTNQRSDDVFETERGGGRRYVGMIGAFRRGSHRAVLLFGHRWACRPYHQTDFHRRRS